MKPQLVFLHGFGEDSRIWDDFMPEAFAAFETHRPDFASWIDCQSIAAYAQKIVSELSTQNTYVFIGHSMGGYIALEIANQFPEITQAVVMLHSTVLADSNEKQAQRDKTAAFIMEHGSVTFIRSFVGNLFAPSFVEKHRSLLDTLILRYQTIDAQGLVAATQAMKVRKDFQSFVQQTSIPFLFILGDCDPLIPVEGILTLLQGKAQHKYVILNDVAHQGCYESPIETREAMLQFINELNV